MTRTLEPNGPAKIGLVAGGLWWCVALAVMTPLIAAIGIAKRGLPLEGWPATLPEVFVGWTLLTAPYVLISGAPVVLVYLGLTRLLHLTRREGTILAIPLALGFFVSVAAVA